VEIDAASNNGVDNIRDIRDEANFTPVSGAYRVYIIDEVHMLSTGAFNALLKTLEEPPEHVKFILATTEVHKLPATILSRCQRFDFRRISPEDIASRVSWVAQQEGLDLSADAAGLIARLADGALRDALSILDQCMSHGTKIDAAVVNEVVGLAGRQHLFDLAASILVKDSAKALDQINDLYTRSVDMERLCGELINHFRNLMVCRTVRDPQNLIVCSAEELQDYIQQARSTNMADILNALNVLGETLAVIRKGLNRRIEMEMAVIKLCGLTTPALDAVPVAPVQPAPQPNPAPEPPKMAKNGPITVVNLAMEEAPKEPPKPKESADYNVSLPGDPVEPSPAVAEPPSVTRFVEEATQTKPAEPASKDPEPPKHISLQEPLPDGRIPTDVWNAVIREVTSHDKVLIGTMNSAKAARRGDALLLQTDNMLLKRFATTDPHREIIRNATYMVLGDYLDPRIVQDDEFFAEPEKIPLATAEVDDYVPDPVPDEPPPPPEEEPITDPEEVDSLIVEYTEEEPQSDTPDPLDEFVTRLQDLGIEITEE